MKTKYQWHDESLKKQAKICQWAILGSGAVGVYALFAGGTPVLIGVLVILLLINIYAYQLRKKDKMMRQDNE
jgi:hypothetical protein